MVKPSTPVYQDFSIFPGWLHCCLRGHKWTTWRRWSDDSPRIVRASLEYLNDDTNIRDCTCCDKRQAERPVWRSGFGWVMSDGTKAPTPI